MPDTTPQSLSEVELLPCPFCGSIAKQHFVSGSWGYYPGKCSVQCTGCDTSTPGFPDEIYVPGKGHKNNRKQAEASAADWWNRRAHPPAAQDREPMTDEMQKQARELFPPGSVDYAHRQGIFYDGWLSAEEAHNIKEPQR